MRGFLERLRYKMENWAQGRYGTDGLSNFLMAAGVVCLLLSFVVDLLSWVAFILFAWALFRSCSKNHEARRAENETYERLVKKPKAFFSLTRKRWVNRKTTVYFTCKGCGQVLSVPKGKGTLRVVCPKCKTETTRKS